MKRLRAVGAFVLALSLAFPAVPSPLSAALVSASAQAARMSSLARWGSAFQAVSAAGSVAGLPSPSLGTALPKLSALNVADPIAIRGFERVAAGLEAQGLTPQAVSASPAKMTQAVVAAAAAEQAAVEGELAKALKAREKGPLGAEESLGILAKLDAEYAPFLSDEARADARQIFSYDLDKVDSGAGRAIAGAMGRLAASLGSARKRQETASDAVDLSGELAKARAALPVEWRLSASGAQVSGRAKPSDALPYFAERRPDGHVEKAFRAHFGDDELVAEMGEAGAGMLSHAVFDLFRTDSFSGRESALNPNGGPVDFMPAPVKLFLSRVFSLLDGAANSEVARQFVAAVGRAGAQSDFESGKYTSRGDLHGLPPSPLPDGEYWDLATGMNGTQFMRKGLDPKTRYKFIDASPFVVAYLREFRRKMLIDGDRGVEGVEIVEADVRKLTRPEKPLAVLRAKNVAYYAPGSEKEIDEMTDWIAPGGQLIIDNDSGSYGQQETILNKHGKMAERLIKEGWHFEFRFGRPGSWFSSGELDTLIFTRPAAGAAPRRGKTWRDYKDIVAAQVAEARRRRW